MLLAEHQITKLYETSLSFIAKRLGAIDTVAVVSSHTPL